MIPVIIVMPRMNLAHHELESVNRTITIMTVIIIISIAAY